MNLSNLEKHYIDFASLQTFFFSSGRGLQVLFFHGHFTCLFFNILELPLLYVIKFSQNDWIFSQNHHKFDWTFFLEIHYQAIDGEIVATEQVPKVADLKKLLELVPTSLSEVQFDWKLIIFDRSMTEELFHTGIKNCLKSEICVASF